jgi:hypothetical protein
MGLRGPMFLHKTGSGRHYFYSTGKPDGYIYPEVGKGLPNIKEAIADALDVGFEVFEFTNQKEAFKFAYENIGRIGA